MDTNRLSTEILNDISTCISGDYDNVHETGFIQALRMGDAADADMVMAEDEAMEKADIKRPEQEEESE